MVFVVPLAEVNDQPFMYGLHDWFCLYESCQHINHILPGWKTYMWLGIRRSDPGDGTSPFIWVNAGMNTGLDANSLPERFCGGLNFQANNEIWWFDCGSMCTMYLCELDV